MTYNVFSGTLNPTQSINHVSGRGMHGEAGSSLDLVLNVFLAVVVGYDRVTTHLENLEKSGNCKVVREKSGKMGKSQGKP